MGPHFEYAGEPNSRELGRIVFVDEGGRKHTAPALQVYLNELENLQHKSATCLCRDSQGNVFKHDGVAYTAKMLRKVIGDEAYWRKRAEELKAIPIRPIEIFEYNGVDFSPDRLRGAIDRERFFANQLSDIGSVLGRGDKGE